MHILLRFLNEETRIWHVVFRKQSRQSDYVCISTKFLQNNLQEGFSVSFQALFIDIQT